MEREVIRLDAENKENRGIKNSVFVDLFCEDEKAAENDASLYNALHDEPLEENALIKVFRIENVIYMNFKNDISFGVNDRILIFGEHQSTINENMPLRALMYVGRAYEALTSINSRYRKTLLKIPTPEFYTFYNGDDDYPTESLLRLSDAYMDRNTGGEVFSLELLVKIININTEKGSKILKKCKILREYSEFIETVKKYNKEKYDNAIEMAVKECIDRGILREYLERKGSQVINMLIAEYDYETDIKVQREEAAEQARAEGMREGMREQYEKDQALLEAKDAELEKYKAFLAAHGLECGINKE